MYVYKRSEPQLWTVGHYEPSGKWQPESDHSTPDEAAERVVLLNGGTTRAQMEHLKKEFWNKAEKQ